MKTLGTYFVLAIACLLVHKNPAIAATFTGLGPELIPRNISGDGNTVVGYGGGWALKWSTTYGLYTLPKYNSEACAVSYDGRVVVGNTLANVGEHVSLVWRDSVDPVLSDFYPILSVSGNGDFIVGNGPNSDVWGHSETNGYYFIVKGVFNPKAMSSDGSVICGIYTSYES